ncbi:hypothetical protein RD1_2348 [Roseobacter denitrificans OCh 114]|uniref:Uncharacterized protein n=1 Tax=Roseobacter denitrificans (strain ATCC 33942 / OCh 114) TaxID=375451 RepID=Q167B9_ROSDO|nr:hypothetical protein RD1_2348 [Roseobacter denitrificans OCh 114]
MTEKAGGFEGVVPQKMRHLITIRQLPCSLSREQA